MCPSDSNIAFVGDFAFLFSACPLANVQSVEEIMGADIVAGKLETPLVLQNKGRKVLISILRLRWENLRHNKV